MTSETRICSVWTAKNDQPVANLIFEQMQRTDDIPLILWMEPVTGRSVPSGFSGLTTPRNWTGVDTAVLAEARLFYPLGMLHLLVAGPTETRWAAWYEGTDQDPPPAWCPQSGTRFSTVTMLKKCRTILLLAKSSHRGLRGPAGDEKQVNAVEYYQHGVLRWWRLEPHGKT